MQKLRVAIAFLAVFFLISTNISFGGGSQVVQDTKDTKDVLQEKEEIILARVLAVTEEVVKDVPNTETSALYQTLTLSLEEGNKIGEKVTLTDTAFNVKKGDRVYLRHVTSFDGDEYYSMYDVYRVPQLLILLSIFFLAVLVVGKKKGLLSLIALFLSFGVIFKILFPSIVTGGNVILLSTLGALLSLFIAMFLTHGFGRVTVASFLGCSLSVLVTLLLSIYAVGSTSLTGFATEESVFLNLATKGGLDFTALLVGGIIIGVIGVIDDVAITQASVVNELRSANPTLSMTDLYRKAMNVGRDHMGAVINTLILAYTGSSLPLVLLLYVSDAPFVQLINREMITTEIVRTMVGSIGLLSAVPLTTLIAVLIIKKGNTKDVHHSHGHHH